MDMNNPGLLNLQALFVNDADSHARQGAHVRVAHHPFLGLPMTPFVLQRADVNLNDFGRLQFREDAIYRNQKGVQLFPPFSIDSGDEITITLAVSATNIALWAEVIADPSGSGLPTLPVDIDVGRIRRPPFDLGRLGHLTVGRSRITLGPTLRDNPLAGLALGSGMEVDAYLTSVREGSVLLGSRSAPPFAFSGTGLVKLVVRGRGTIAGVRWLDSATAQKRLKFQTIDVLNLPHQGGPRYLSLSDWQVLCDRRRDAQSPKRRPMQDTAQAPARFAAAGHSQADELSRVNTLFDSLEEPLDELITGGTPQHQQVRSENLTNPDGTPILEDGVATATMASLPLMLQGTADPGVGTFMGYKTLDQGHNKNPEQRLSFYRLIGFFRNPTDDLEESATLSFKALIALLRARGPLLAPSQIFELFTSFAGPFLARLGIRVDSDLEPHNGYQMTALAVADHMAPLAPVVAPRVETPRHDEWLPSPPDAPLRATETDINGMIAGGTVAAKRRTPPSGADWDNLNSSVDHGDGVWHALLIPSVIDPATATGPIPDIFLHTNDTGPEPFAVLACQQDRFGRFSEWARANGAAGPRPRPPRPIVMATYKQPAISSGTHVGKVTATIPLPEESSLAPGGFKLDHANLTVKMGGASFGGLRVLPVSVTVSIHPDAPVPAAQDRRAVQVKFDGPSIPATQSREMTFVAVWVDTAGQSSAQSQEVKLILRDPYPPTQMPIPDVLCYAARPDATGKAWVERSWPTGGTGTAYGVYYADENRMRDHLRNDGSVAATTLLNQLAAELDPAARATLLRANQELFPDHLFERLKNVIETDGATTGFRHALSGSLRVLSAYKIAAEAVETAARPDLNTLDTVYYGVPNSDPPVQPVITAKQVEPNPAEPDFVTELTITVRAGVSEAETVRIRRTRSGVIDPLRNPIIGTVRFGPIDPGTGLQTAMFRDVGLAAIAPRALLKPFVKYAWIAEAQGAEEPGSAMSAGGSVPGLWSKPSAPVTLDVTPPAAPVPPIFDRLTANPSIGGVKDLTISYDYPVDMVPGTPGPWTIRVERAFPDQPLEVIMEEKAAPGAGFLVPGDLDDPGRLIASGTRFLVRVIDPIGRESLPDERVIS